MNTSVSVSDTSIRRVLFFVLAFLILLQVFYTNLSVSLWDEDEGAYAGFAQRILQTGDWLIPKFWWADVHRKTPFHFWTIACSFRLFGVNEFALRLPSGLAAIGTYVLVWKMGKPIWGERISSLAAFILGVSLFVPNLCKIAVTDTLLLFSETLAILGLLNYIQKPSWTSNLALWVGVCIGLLIKGPPVLILTGGAWLSLAIFHPNRKNLIGTHPWLYGLLALLPLLLWGYAAWQRDGGIFITWLWEWYTFSRVNGEVFGQTGPAGYHLAVLTGSFIFFLAWLPSGFQYLFSSIRKGEHTNILLGIWLVWAWIFYEIMKSKLPAYSIAAQPAFAILLAQGIVKNNLPLWVKITGFVQLLLGLGMGVALGIVGKIYLGNTGFYATSAIGFFVWASMLSITICLFVDYLKQYAIYIALFASVLFSIFAWAAIANLVENTPIKSIRRVVEKMQLIANETNPPLMVYLTRNNHEHRQKKISLPFYVQRAFPHWVFTDNKDSLRLFVQKNPEYMVLTGDVSKKEVLNLMEEENKNIKADSIDWWSSDDKLKSHPYFIISTYKNNK